MTPEEFAEKYGMTVEAARDTMARYIANPNDAEFAPVLSDMIAATGVSPKDITTPLIRKIYPEPSPFTKPLAPAAPPVRPTPTASPAMSKPLAIPHPEEPMNPAATLANTDVNAILNKWLLDWGVPAQHWDYWKKAIDIQVYDIYPAHITAMGVNQDIPAATWDAGGKRHLAIKPKWLNPGVIAHEQAHNSYALLTPSQKAAFSAVYAPLKNTEPLIKLLYSKNTYGLTNDIEGHAEVYRYIGQQMPAQLMTYFPRLF